MPNYNRLVPREEANQLGWTPRDQTRGRIGGVEEAGDHKPGRPMRSMSTPAGGCL
jgi:quinoprotein glucose dehydrogenase